MSAPTLRTFKVKLFREVISNDVYDYEIEAVDHDAAVAQARLDCAEFDNDCPDDVVDEGSNEIGDWKVATSFVEEVE